MRWRAWLAVMRCSPPCVFLMRRLKGDWAFVRGVLLVTLPMPGLRGVALMGQAESIRGAILPLGS